MRHWIFRESVLSRRLVNRAIQGVFPAAGRSTSRVTKTLTPVASQNPNKKKVLFVTFSETADLVKTGGLGDVSAACSRAMAHLHDVRVLIPGYPQVMHKWRTRFISSANSAAMPHCPRARSGAWTCRTDW